MLRHVCSALALLLAVAAYSHHPSQEQAEETAVAPVRREKRYVAALARNGDLPFTVRREWHKKLHPAVSAHRGLQAALAPVPNPLGIPGKRYVGSIARSGQLPGKRAVEEDVIDDLDEQMRKLLLEEISTTEELEADERRLQKLEEIRDDYSAASLGNPGQNLNEFQNEEDVKRGISTLAKNGQLPAPLTPGDNRSEDVGDESAESKRGGVSALARLGYLPPHKKNLAWLMSQLQEPVSKRNIGSLARGLGLPSGSAGKRNLGALARGGGFSALRYANSKKNGLLDVEAEKRGAAWEVREQALPGGNALLALPVGLEEGSTTAHDWRVPQQSSAREFPVDENEFGNGSADYPRYDDVDTFRDARDLKKRYVAALLRQGRLPVGDGSLFRAPFASSNDESSAHSDYDSLNEDKRHIGALRRLQKKSTGASAHDSVSGRAKREAWSYPSDEIPLPVFQTGDQTDYNEALVQRMMLTANETPGPDKRFLGRIPQMSRSRTRTQMQPSSVRRDRPRSRNI